ncbi:MLO-like protein 10 [Acorus calamus]|uniref:MLO-like protein 10 n=1 Tax=Acorus calamus TaxID=4465 RepID=A0AAV9FKP8_ACOCL|nr:MLO-like protein 10 [Acorus calamus]
MAGGGGEGSRKLDQTPTWAVAAVCAVIIVISIILEKGLHRIGEWFNERRKKALFEALEKVKSELMILGFISLLLTFGQSYIAKICISEKTADTMLPCRLRDSTEEANVGHWQRHLLEDIFYSIKSNRRGLSGGETGETCAKGKVPLVSIEGIHQLHIFIFFLAIFHVLYSALTMALGRAKIRGWKEWEKETGSLDYEFSNGWQALLWVELVPLIMSPYRVVVQFVCSYITLPLYALVSQMGSHMKKSIFDEQTSRALKKWRLAAKKRQGKSGNTPGGTPDASPSASQVHPLQRYKTIGHSGSVKSRKYLDQDVSDSECETPSLVTSTSTTILIPGDMEGGSHEAAPPLRGVVEHRNEDEFSFSKPPQV